MNIQSAQMLQDALQNFGNSAARQRQQQIENAYRNSQLDLEKQRNDTDAALRQAQLQYAIDRGKSEDARAAAGERRADAAEKRLDLANQAHITADLKSDDGQTMTFTGTPDQLQGLVDQAKQQGKNVTVSNKKQFAATYHLPNGSSFSFDDQKAAQDFRDQFQNKTGIDLDTYNPKAAPTPKPTESTEEKEYDPVQGNPGTPAVPADYSHYLAPWLNHGPIPATPGTPTLQKRKVTVRSFGTPTSPDSQPTNAPSFSMPSAPSSDSTNAPGTNTVPPFTGLTPGMGNTALNTNGIPTGKVDPRDAAWLTQSPTPQRIAKFESTYGKGSSAQYLTQAAQASQ